MEICDSRKQILPDIDNGRTRLLLTIIDAGLSTLCGERPYFTTSYPMPIFPCLLTFAYRFADMNPQNKTTVIVHNGFSQFLLLFWVESPLFLLFERQFTDVAYFFDHFVFVFPIKDGLL